MTADRGDIPVADVPVVILCGGMGTRIREASESLPKPLIDIGGRPIVWHIMKLYGEAGFRRFVLCLGYKGREIKEYFLRYRENLSDFTINLGSDEAPAFASDVGMEDWEVTCVDTGLETGTGGRIPRVARYLDGDEFMLTYGDGIGDVDLPALVRHHRSEDTIGTVTAVHPTSRFGEVEVADGRVSMFAEKPTAGGWVSGGFFMFQRDFLDYLSPDESCFLEQGPLQKLARDGELSLFPHEGFWMGMDTYREYTELNRLWVTGLAPWKVWS